MQVLTFAPLYGQPNRARIVYKASYRSKEDGQLAAIFLGTALKSGILRVFEWESYF